MKTYGFFVALNLLFFLSTAHAFDLVESPYLLGDWGGYRSHLSEQGVNFTLGYGSELAHNYSGGVKQMTAYTDQWVFGAGFDSEKLNLWKGGTAQVMITNRNGENLGGVAQIGNNMLIQEVYGRGQTWHMTQFWINQKFFEKSLEWKIGRMTVGEDFASFSCDFQNLSFCGSQPGNIVGSYWVNWPTSQWATRIKYHSTDNTFWQIGAYQVNPNYVDDDYAQAHGMSLDNPSGSTGALIPLEYVWTPVFNSMKGSYKFGIWYNTSRGPDLTQDVNGGQRGVTGAPAFQHGAQYGGFISFVQQVTGTEAEPGLFLFLNVAQADTDTAQVDRQISIGGQYHGPFNRHDDSIGFGLSCTNNNPRFASFQKQENARLGSAKAYGEGCEYDSELYYSYSPIKSVFLRPNLQYILRPGGNSDNKDAFVVGLKSGIAF